MRTLYEISNDLLALDVALAECGGDISNEAGEQLEAWFDALGEECDAKIDAYCALIREMESRADAREVEAKRLAALAASDANNAKRLKNRLKSFLEFHQMKKLETERFRLTVAADGGVLPLIVPEPWECDPAIAPEQFHRHVVQLDRDAIREAIRNDEAPEGCALGERGSHLRIR